MLYNIHKTSARNNPSMLTFIGRIRQDRRNFLGPHFFVLMTSTTGIVSYQHVTEIPAAIILSQQPVVSTNGIQVQIMTLTEISSHLHCSNGLINLFDNNIPMTARRQSSNVLVNMLNAFVLSVTGVSCFFLHFEFYYNEMRVQG